LEPSSQILQKAKPQQRLLAARVGLRHLPRVVDPEWGCTGSTLQPVSTEFFSETAVCAALRCVHRCFTVFAAATSLGSARLRTTSTPTRVFLKLQPYICAVFTCSPFQSEARLQILRAIIAVLLISFLCVIFLLVENVSDK